MILSIVAEQTIPNGETNRLEMMTEGRYYLRDGANCLEYEEGEPGERGVYTTLMMVSGRLVSLIRQGENTTHMVFSEGKKSYNVTKTQNGRLEMGILPTSMELDMGGETGGVTLEYELDIGGQFTGSNMISISYRPKKH